jgi:NADPH:quinone reductase-like Zn-dependent oxidoreductase
MTTMVKAVRIQANGGPEVMVFEDVVVDAPGAGTVTV